MELLECPVLHYVEVYVVQNFLASKETDSSIKSLALHLEHLTR